jgi:hypothetical protein
MKIILMPLRKRQLILSCFQSILHIEGTKGRVELFHFRLEKYPLPIKASIKFLNSLSMTTSLAFLVCFKLAIKIILNRTTILISKDKNTLAFYCTLNQKKAIERLANEVGIEFTSYPTSYFFLFRSYFKAILISLTKRKRLNKLSKRNLNFLTETIKFIFYYNYVDQYLKDIPSTCIVANDHSPEPLAFMANAKLKGSKVVYLQHGHISKYFPPLFRFDLSVLYGEKSLNLYKKIGAISKEVSISGYKYSSARFLKPCPKDFHITIFPNVIDEEKLLKIINELTENPETRKVYIKPHPLHTPSLSFKIKLKDKGNVEFLPHDFDFRPETHVGIAGNSSIHMELLSEGIPTIYYDKMDSIEYDYYEFVRSNSVIEFESLKDINRDEINSFYLDKNWKDNVKIFDAAFYSKAQLKEELSKIHTFFNQ